MLEPLLMVAQEPATVQTIAGYTPSPDVVKFLSIAPPILLQFVFFSPLPAVKAFRDSGTTGDVSIMPYAMMVANGTLWFTYGALLSNATIMLPNITAILMGAGYCATFLKYRSPQSVTLPYLGASAGLVCTTVGAAAFLPLASAQSFIGYLGCGVCVAMFGGPLTSMSSVLRDRSAASIPMGFTLFSTVNTSVWLGYGALVLGDPFIWACVCGRRIALQRVHANSLLCSAPLSLLSHLLTHAARLGRLPAGRMCSGLLRRSRSSASSHASARRRGQ